MDSQSRSCRIIASIDALEPRRLLASSFANVDISRRPGNEAEGAIVVDRTNPQRLFAFSNTDDETPGLFAATSADGGVTWSASLLAGPGSALPPACCDPTAAFDDFGNLFIAYMNNDVDSVEVAVSTDGGQTFTPAATLGRKADQPTIAAGPGGVWVTFNEGNRVVVTGAQVNALGSVGGFSLLQRIHGSTRGRFGDIAVGPDGQVAVTYQRSGRRSILGVNVDPDGFGPLSFGRRVNAATTGVKLFDIVPAQPERAVDAEVGIVYDRSTGPFRGRLYLMYTDVAAGSAADRNNMDVLLRYSDTGGSSWGNAIRINDDTGTATQILPRLAHDQTSGEAAITWLDTRDDNAAGSPDNTDDAIDTDVLLYAAVARPEGEGLSISRNVRVSAGSSNAVAADNRVELGDYTGLDFHAGIVRPVWADNSNSTGENPDGAGNRLDLFTAAVPAESVSGPFRFALGGFEVGEGPAATVLSRDYPVVRRPGALKLPVFFADGNGIDFSTIGGDDLRITGPGGHHVFATLRRLKPARDGRSAVAMYLIAGPTGGWSRSEDGVYTISLAPGSILDPDGNAATEGILGNLVVSLG